MENNVEDVAQAANTPEPPAAEARSSKRTRAQILEAARRAKKARFSDENPSPSAPQEDESHSAASPESSSNCSRSVRSSSSQRSSQVSQSPVMKQSKARNRLLVPRRIEPELVGCRLLDMPTAKETLIHWLACPRCKKLHQLKAYQVDEVSLGIAGEIHFRCDFCREVTLQQPTSRVLRPDRSTVLQELNLRHALGCVVSGMGEKSGYRYLGVLGHPSLDDRAYDRAMARLVPALEAAGDESCRRWLEHERMQAIMDRMQPRGDGRVGIPVSFDTQWLKPGKAFNAPDGYGVGVGGRTGKVIMTAYRTKVGTLHNHTGSSGSMEPAMGAEIVKALGTGHTGVYVEALCLDLDAKTPKAVAEACKEADLPTPRKLHDPNHYIKAVKGRFVEVKKAVKMNKVFPPETQLRLAQEIALALHQKRQKGRSTLRGAISVVFKHAFNDHSECRGYFKCPCAPPNPTRTRSTYNKEGLWLDTAGGPAGGAKLRPLLEEVRDKITSDASMDALTHSYNTQWCEAVNSLHVSMHPKRRDLSKGRLGRAIHKFTAARYNDGVQTAVSNVLKHLGIEPGDVTSIILAKDDAKRRRHAALKASIRGKGKRKAVKQRRSERDKKASDREGEPSYTANTLFDEMSEDGACSDVDDNLPAASNESDEPGSSADHAAQPPCRSSGPRKCGFCKQTGHNVKTCPAKRAEASNASAPSEA